MSTPRLLPGPSNSSAEQFPGELEKLRRENQNLQRQVGELDDEVRERDRRITTLEKGVDVLQRALAPTFKGMQMIFGVFEDLGINPEDAYSQTTTPKGDASFWETQKRRFPGKAAEIIDMLLERSMNTTQLASTGRMDNRTVTKAIYTLTKAGLVRKDGGVFSLTRQ